MADERMTEISEADLLRYRRQEQLLGTVLKTPAARKKLAAAVKEVDATDPLAKEADIVDPIDAKFSKLEDENAKLAKQISDDKAQREQDTKVGAIVAEQERGFDALRKSKWTQEGIDKVKKVMEDKGILDVAIAAKWVESQTPPQSPITPTGSGAWGFMDAPASDGQADIKRLIESKGQDDNVLHKMVQDTLADMRQH